MTYQLEPLWKALRMPQVSLFIADDVGLGKTIEAGLIMQELLRRKKLQRVVVLQWQEEMHGRFGMGFAVMDRAYVSRLRRDRGRGINPCTTLTCHFAVGACPRAAGPSLPSLQPLEKAGGAGSGKSRRWLPGWRFSLATFTLVVALHS